MTLLLMLLFLRLLFMFYGHIMGQWPKSHLKKCRTLSISFPHSQPSPPTAPLSNHDAEMLVYHRRSFLATRRLKRWISRLGWGGGSRTHRLSQQLTGTRYLSCETPTKLFCLSRALTQRPSPTRGGVGVEYRPSCAPETSVICRPWHCAKHTFAHPADKDRRRRIGREGKERKKEVEVEGQKTSFPKWERHWGLIRVFITEKTL